MFLFCLFQITKIANPHNALMNVMSMMFTMSNTTA